MQFQGELHLDTQNTAYLHVAPTVFILLVHFCGFQNMTTKKLLQVSLEIIYKLCTNVLMIKTNVL